MPFSLFVQTIQKLSNDGQEKIAIGDGGSASTEYVKIPKLGVIAIGAETSFVHHSSEAVITAK